MSSKRRSSEGIGDAAFGAHFLPINADSGFHIGAARLPDAVPLGTISDYEAYIALLRDLPRYFAEHIALMRRGIELGMTVPRVVLEGYEVTISSHVVEDPEASVFYAPFAAFPERIGETDRRRLRTAGAEAVREGPVAAYRAFLAFFEDEYRPAARTTIGASELPDGREYYAFLVGRFTTLDRTAVEIHRVGPGRSGAHPQRDGGGDARDGLHRRMGRLPGIPADGPAVLCGNSRRAAAGGGMDLKADGRRASPPFPAAAPPAVTPWSRCPTPSRRSSPAAVMWERRSPSTRPGRYWVNTYRLQSRPLYTLEALSLHEAVPGHHLQISLAKELDLPEFRRHYGIGAYSEGWGLYSERLGLEVGFYQDPYSNFGRLTYEMWRACRLVVDTGMHALGWSRQQTLDYLAGNTALSIHEITTETDRYIAWPGQALGYKMGELKIRELRALAETELGGDFDIREFHDQILSNGPVTLPILDRLIRTWIAERRTRRAPDPAS